MTEQEWLSSSDLVEMLRWLVPDGEISGRSWVGVSDRKLLLFAETGCEVCRKCLFGPLESAIYYATASCGTRQNKADILRCIVGNPFRPVVWHEEYMDPFEGYVATRWTAEADRIRTHDGGKVVKIARVIYEERAWDLMPALHDALVEAGCDNEEMLAHCRGQERCPRCMGSGKEWVQSGKYWATCPCDWPSNPKRAAGWIPLGAPHVRGCWVIDLLTGRE